MPKSAKKSQARSNPVEAEGILALARIDADGKATLIPQTDKRFRAMGTSVASMFNTTRTSIGLEENPFFFGRTPYTRLTWSRNLRQLLLPRETDFDQIMDRIEFYRRHVSWINRGLILRAAFNASEIAVQAPNKPDQSEWMRQIARELKFFTYAREWFWQLRAYGQVVTLWKTEPGGFKPLSIECADLKAHQPRGPGLSPRIVVLPNKVPAIRKLLRDSEREGEQGAIAREQLKRYPQPLVDAAKSGKAAEVAAEDLAPYGYHLDYTALDRRHYEDLAFPGMYSIFGDIEMVEMAKSVDINALSQYKAAIFLVTLGPENPKGDDISILPTDSQLKKLESTLMSQVRNAFPTLVGRGDIRMSFIVPPIEVFTPQKYTTAVSNIFDWLGIPKVAWAGQSLEGSFASAQVSLKFLQQESEDERALFREQHAKWFFDRSNSSNAFVDSEWPVISFNPNSLTEPNLVFKIAQFLWEMGASESTVFSSLGHEGEVEATQLKAFQKYLKQQGIEFVPRSLTGKGPTQSEGRPLTVDQPTPERQTKVPQPRPSNATRAVVEDLNLDETNPISGNE